MGKHNKDKKEKKEKKSKGKGNRMKKKALILYPPEESTTSHLAFTQVQKTAWMTFPTETALQFQMIPETRQEHFFCYRITELLH